MSSGNSEFGLNPDICKMKNNNQNNKKKKKYKFSDFKLNRF